LEVNEMTEDKDQEKLAPSAHGPGAVSEGASENPWEDQQHSSRLHASELGPPDGRTDAEFSAELWRQQVIDDTTLIASQKLILLVLGHEFEENEGTADLKHSWLALHTSLSIRIIAEHTTALDALGWYSRTRRSHSMLYEAKRGRVDDLQ
jgi:hypothetical protein